MKNGKIAESVLKRSVLKQLHTKDAALLQAAGPGLDYAAFSSGEGEEVVLASAVVDLPSTNLAERAVCMALNNVVCSGAKPKGVMITLTIPTLWNEAQLRELMRDVDAACAKWQVSVMGGHTTVSRAVKTAVLSVTGVGTVGAEKRISSKGMKAGMSLVAVNPIAFDGTSLLAMNEEEALRQRFSQPFIDQAREFSENLSIKKAAELATQAGAAAMHDLSEGGVFGALWEMAEASGCGLEIDLRKIPIRQETVEICEFFDLNPYKLLSAGGLLVAAADGSRIVRAMEQEGIPAIIIGTATDSNDRVLLQEGERRFLETVQTDEIYKIYHE